VHVGQPHEAPPENYVHTHTLVVKNATEDGYGWQAFLRAKSAESADERARYEFPVYIKLNTNTFIDYYRQPPNCEEDVLF